MKTERFTEIPINIRIRNEDISEILHKAFDEGGSLHWCYGAKAKYNHTPINEVIGYNGVLLLLSVDGLTYELTRDKFLIGLQLALPYLDNAITGVKLATDAIDCIAADFIVQLAIFNELIYD